MNSQRPSSGKQPHRHWIYFTLALVLIMTTYTVYGMNIVWWRNSPDFGWRTMYESGANVVAEANEAGKAAGLRTGDTIISINGRRYTSFAELFTIRNAEPGSTNVYSVMRDRKTLQITITTGRLGLKEVLQRSGPLFVIGLLYVFIGVLVFLMKPQAAESWLFCVMTFLFGMEISFLAPSDLMVPLRFFDVRLLIDVILPAPIIHLALRFPKTRSFLVKRPRLRVVPYVPALILFVLYKVTSEAYWDSPAALGKISDAYLMTAVLIFLASMVWNFLKDSSVVIRLQSQVIFIGIVLGFFLPTANLLTLTIWQFHLFPNPALVFAICLSMFPLSIGYTIVKHDLFDIDVIVRRTYGYMLSTGAILVTYGLIAVILNLTFHSSEISTSPVFSILFAIAVVFFFRPLHERFQGLVDRVFYRQHYDYRKTIKETSEAMIHILNPEEIHKKLISTVVREMFLENGLLLLPKGEREVYRVEVVEGCVSSDFGSVEIIGDDVFPRLLKEKRDAVFRYETDLNPAYEPCRDELQSTFHLLASELVLPLMYKDEMRGIISLGRKKSGKMFTLEDLDLLKTITNQSSIALENAKLFKENIEKCRMEEELKIAHDLQSSMLPEKAPRIEGFAIAANSISAREVGGDFYDFIEIGPNGTCERLAIIIGDVSGKAVSGALVMAASRSIFRVLAGSNVSVKEVMTTGNARLMNDIKKGMFVALLYAVLNPDDKTLRLSNAGQTQPVICSQNKSEPSYIDTEGDRFPLGILKDCDYEETRVTLKQGDTVVFYTDGVVEAMNAKEELYGFERLLSSIDQGRDLGADELLQKLMADIGGFVEDAEQHDDLTMVVVKVE